MLDAADRAMMPRFYWGYSSHTPFLVQGQGHGEIQGLVRGLREQGIGILITDHNVRETLQSVDRAYIVTQGRILKEGRAEELIRDPRVREVYLGHTFDVALRGVTAAEEHELLD